MFIQSQFKFYIIEINLIVFFSFYQQSNSVFLKWFANNIFNHLDTYGDLESKLTCNHYQKSKRKKLRFDRLSPVESRSRQRSTYLYFSTNKKLVTVSFFFPSDIIFDPNQSPKSYNMNFINEGPLSGQTKKHKQPKKL